MSEKITTIEELDALPVGSVWLTAGGLLGETIRPINRGLNIACVRIEGVEHLTLTISGSDFPITVLYRPDAPASTPEPTYDPITHTWSHECPCIRAEQRDPECPWHGRHDSPTGATVTPEQYDVLATAFAEHWRQHKSARRAFPLGYTLADIALATLGITVTDIPTGDGALAFLDRG